MGGVHRIRSCREISGRRITLEIRWIWFRGYWRVGGRVGIGV